MLTADSTPTAKREKLERARKALLPLGEALGKPQPADWLEGHVELGQTYFQYLGSRPKTATPQRNKIYIAPLGSFDAKSRRVIDCVSEFMLAFYGLPVVVQDAVALEAVDPKSRRVADWGGEQILTTYIISELKRSLPPDAATYLCLTSSDLWAGKGYNFVFGSAHLRDRVGVWSFHRFGTDFATVLPRTLKTAVHETGHMFGMMHCTAYNCGMCGANSLYEADRRPIHFCPECTPKVAWATGIDLAERANNLRFLCEEWGLKDESQYYAQEADRLATTRKRN